MALTNFPSGLSSFGIPVIGNQIPTGGNYYFVDSAVGGDGNDASWESPLATIDAAINKCTANHGDVIVVKPGHAETIATAAAIAADVAGIRIVGIGSGTDMPEVTFGSLAAASLSVTAASIVVSGIRFKCGIASMTAGIDVNSTDFTIENCEFHESGTTGLVWIDINGGGANACDRAKIRGNRFYCATAGNWDRAIELGEVADGVEITDNVIIGDFDDAGIHNITGKVMTNLLIARNYVRNNQSGQHAIELVSACTGTAFDNRLVTDAIATGFDAGALSCMGNLWNITTGGDSEGVPVNPVGDATTNYIGTNDADNAALTDLVAANEDGSILERLEQLQEAVNIGSGTSLGANKSLVDALGTNGLAITDSAVSVLGVIGSDTATTAFASTNVVSNEDGNVLERLEMLQTGVIKGAGTPVGAAKSLVDCLGTNGLAITDSAVSVLGVIGSDTATTAFASTNVVANEDGNVLERLEQLQEAINKGTGTALAANTSLQDVIGTGITGAAGLTLQAALGTTGTTVTDSAVSVLGAIGANNADNAFASGSVAANEDGSVLERLEQIQEAVNIGTGTSLGANKSLVDCLGTNGLAITDSAVSVLGVIGSDTATTAFASTNVVANEDGNVLERLEQLQEAVNKGTGTALATNESLVDLLYGGNGISVWPSPLKYDNNVSIAEVLAYVQEGIRAGNGGTTLGTNASLVDALGVNGVATITVGAGSLIGANGAQFIVQKSLTSSAVTQAGVDVTGLATGGDIVIDDIIFETDTTGLATGTNFTLERSAGEGVLTFFGETVAALGASASERLATGSVTSTGGPLTLKTGAKLVAKCTAMDCTGGGVIKLTMLCRRVAAGATLAAA